MATITISIPDTLKTFVAKHLAVPSDKLAPVLTKPSSSWRGTPDSRANMKWEWVISSLS